MLSLQVEVIHTERQGHTCVYILEVTPFELKKRRLFKRFSHIMEFYRNMRKLFNSKDNQTELPEIPHKSIMNHKTELTERRQIAFESFFQTLVLCAHFRLPDEVQEFLQIGHSYR